MSEETRTLVGYTTASDITHAVNELDVGFKNLSRDIEGSSNVRKIFRDSWETQLGAWNQFRDENQTFWANPFGIGSEEKLKTLDTYRDKLGKWRDAFSRETGEKASGPSPEGPKKPFPWAWIIVPTALVIGIVAAASAVSGAAHSIRGKD